MNASQLAVRDFQERNRQFILRERELLTPVSLLAHSLYSLSSLMP